MKDHSQFLYGVQQYVEKNPEVAAYISDFVAKGVTSALNQTRERAADMEIALSVAIAKRWPKRDSLILSKLKKWDGKSCIPWTSTIAALEAESMYKPAAEPATEKEE